MKKNFIRGNAATVLLASLASMASTASLMAASGAAHAGTDGTGRSPQAHQRFAAAARGGHVDVAVRNESANGRWRGKSYAEWAADHLRWMFSIPLNVNPLTNSTGLDCGINQEGPTWFLSFSVVPSHSFICTIPHGRAIVVPVAAGTNDYPCPTPAGGAPFEPAAGQTLEDFLTAGLSPIIDLFTPAATLDGKPLKVRRVTTPIFGFTAATSLSALDACVTGSPQLGVTDGFFVFVDPPARGDHVLQISSDGPPGPSVETIHLQVR